MNSIPQKSNSITIETGEVNLLINNDPNRVVCFNPSDLAFVTALYEAIRKFSIVEANLKKKTAEIDKNKELDEFGIPVNVSETLKLNKEFCENMRKEVDDVFGEDTSQTAFGSFNSLDMFAQFFDGITPFIKAKRNAQMNKHREIKSETGVMS